MGSLLLRVRVEPTERHRHDASSEIEVDHLGGETQLAGKALFGETVGVRRLDLLRSVDRVAKRRADRIPPGTADAPAAELGHRFDRVALPRLGPLCTEQTAIGRQPDRRCLPSTEQHRDPAPTDVHHADPLEPHAVAEPAEPAGRIGEGGDPGEPGRSGGEVAVIVAGLSHALDEGDLTRAEPRSEPRQVGVKVETVADRVGCIDRNRQSTTSRAIRPVVGRDDRVEVIVPPVQEHRDEHTIRGPEWRGRSRDRVEDARHHPERAAGGERALEESTAGDTLASTGGRELGERDVGIRRSDESMARSDQ